MKETVPGKSAQSSGYRNIECKLENIKLQDNPSAFKFSN